MHVEMSIDKVSFTAKLASGVDRTGLHEYLSNPAVECKYWMSNNFMYQHNFNMADGSFIQYGESQNEQNVRVEFNPNKADFKILSKVIARLKYPKITRIDWAIDYYDFDFSKYQVKDLVGRKEILYKSRSKQLETHYIGSYASDNFIRIYNKMLELLRSYRKSENDDEIEFEGKRKIWRVEAVQKDFTMMVEKELESLIEVDGKMSRLKKKEKVKTEGYVFQNPFECIEIYEKYNETSKVLKMQEKAMLFYLEHHPEEWASLDPKSRKKYKDLNYSSGYKMLTEQPSKIFEKEKGKLAKDLYSLLKPAIDNGKYLTGIIPNIEYSMMFLLEQESKENPK